MALMFAEVGSARISVISGPHTRRVAIRVIRAIRGFVGAGHSQQGLVLLELGGVAGHAGFMP